MRLAGRRELEEQRWDRGGGAARGDTSSEVEEQQGAAPGVGGVGGVDPEEDLAEGGWWLSSSWRCVILCLLSPFWNFW
jgi:RimJ/RimL family protein N-acetyltransferase